MTTIRTVSIPLAIALAMGGCSLPDTDSMNKFNLSAFAPRSVGSMRDERVRPITAEDLVDPQGRVRGSAGAPTLHRPKASLPRPAAASPCR